MVCRASDVPSLSVTIVFDVDCTRLIQLQLIGGADETSAAHKMALIQLYDETNQLGKLVSILESAAMQEATPPWLLKRLIELYLADGRIDNATTMLDLAIQRGLDSASVVELRSQLRR